MSSPLLGASANDLEKLPHNWMKSIVSSGAFYEILPCISPYRAILQMFKMFPKHFLNSFKQEVIDVANLMGIDKATLAKWYIGQQVKMLKIPLVSGAVEDTVWCWKGADNPNFISTGRVFISVIKKGAQSPEIELIEPLKAALVEANSSPMHLLMAKIRASIDENGLEQANKIVSQKIVYEGLGRTRNVKQMPDGFIYAAVDGKGVVKLEAE